MVLRFQDQLFESQSGGEPTHLTLPWRANESDLAWWKDARLGLFVHFGVAAIEGVELSWGRGLPRPFDIQALVQHEGEPAQDVPHDVYDALWKRFYPEEFDARSWVNTALAAGAGYLVLTAKHHDGFCLWNSDLTDYTVAGTPFGRDIVAEVAAACHESGLRFGIYYSQRDWHHPEYLQGDNAEYRAYMAGQLDELLTRYGRVDIIWFDSFGESDLEQDWDAAEMVRRIRELQPGILINNRLAILGDYNGGPPEIWGDFDTPEQRVGRAQLDRPWESCMTLSGEQWGYRPGVEPWDLATCVRALVSCAVGDGNLLLNTGPDALGRIPDSDAERLGELGEWMRLFGESVRTTRGLGWDVAWGGATARAGYADGADARGSEVFVHVLSRPDDGRVIVPLAVERITSASAWGGHEIFIEAVDAGSTSLSIPTTTAIDEIIRLTIT